MKVRSLYELQEKLDGDLAWRKREFTTLKFMVGAARQHEKLILLRAAITLLYAHWEGHVKFCASAYLSYLNCLSPKYSEMKENFFQMSLGERFKDGFSIKKFSSQKEVYNYIQSEQSDGFCVNEKVVIDTESNLKYEVVLNILGQLGLNEGLYELKENFIDSKLIKCRNCIAHGDKVDERELFDTYSELEEELLSMIQDFQSSILNAAENRCYLKAVG